MIGVPHDVQQWSEALDEYEATLTAHRVMLDDLDHGQVVTVPMSFVPPTLSGPLPAALEARALRLLDETSALMLLAKDLSIAASPLTASVRRFPSFADATVLDRVL